MTKVIHSSAAIALLSATAFANPAAAAPAATNGGSKGKPGAPAAADRVAPIFTNVRADIPLPVAKNGRGGKSELAKKLEPLEVNQSVGYTNKTKKQISSTLSKINNAESNFVQKTDANGAPLFKNGAPIKDANGAIVSYNQEKDLIRLREYEAHDMNPKEDPDGATVRIWRIK